MSLPSISIRAVSAITSSPNYHWWAYGAVAVGMFINVMDQSGINIALPKIADEFSADIPTHGSYADERQAQSPLG